ncbi:DNA ligase 1 [Platanthera zijinensis]|uniref:DNA ligase 1 n=1 Tax=Platanthera zijinensis TaxID=2320716 RepID=A0AAP0BBZ2_9ASPA
MTQSITASALEDTASTFEKHEHPSKNRTQSPSKSPSKNRSTGPSANGRTRGRTSLQETSKNPPLTLIFRKAQKFLVNTFLEKLLPQVRAGNRTFSHRRCQAAQSRSDCWSSTPSRPRSKISEEDGNTAFQRDLLASWPSSPIEFPFGFMFLQRLLILNSFQRSTPSPSLLAANPLFSHPKNPHKTLPDLPCSSLRRRTMSSGRTVADVLMGASRAAATNKNRPASSSQPQNPSSPAKKPKTLETLAPSDDPKRPDTADILIELKKKGSEFDPRAAASWKDSEPVSFLFLARALDLISNESGRIAMTDIICNVFRTVMATSPNDLLPTVYLSANRIAPPHEGIELGIGDASLIKALSEAYGRKEEHVNKQLQELGDLGLVAKASRSSQRMLYKPQRLTIAKVFDTFRSIAKVWQRKQFSWLLDMHLYILKHVGAHLQKLILNYWKRRFSSLAAAGFQNNTLLQFPHPRPHAYSAYTLAVACLSPPPGRYSRQYPMSSAPPHNPKPPLSVTFNPYCNLPIRTLKFLCRHLTSSWIHHPKPSSRISLDLGFSTQIRSHIVGSTLPRPDLSICGRIYPYPTLHRRGKSPPSFSRHRFHV